LVNIRIIQTGRRFKKPFQEVKFINKNETRSSKKKIAVNKVHYPLFSIDSVKLYLTKDGIKPQKVHANSIVQFAVPEDVEALKSFLTLCNFSVEFLPNFAMIAKPLTELLRKSQPWTQAQEQQESFKDWRILMAEPLVLAHPDYSKPFVVNTDDSDVGIGALSLQKQDDKFRIICFPSRTLNPVERNYSSRKKNLLQLFGD